MLDVYGVLVYMVNRLATRCSRGDLILRGGTSLNEKLKRESCPDIFGQLEM